MSNSSRSTLTVIFTPIVLALILGVAYTDNNQNETIDAMKERIAALEAVRAPKQPVEVAEARPPAPSVAPARSDDGQPLVGDVIPTATSSIEMANGDACWTLKGGSFVVEKIDGDWALIRYYRQGPPSSGLNDCPNGAYAVRQVSWLKFDKEKARERQEQLDATRRLAPK